MEDGINHAECGEYEEDWALLVLDFRHDVYRLSVVPITQRNVLLSYFDNPPYSQSF